MNGGYMLTLETKDPSPMIQTAGLMGPPRSNIDLRIPNKIYTTFFNCSCPGLTVP